MTTLWVIDKDGQERGVEARNDVSVMEALRPLGLGIEGECEGSLACATCHVWVDKEWADRLAPPSEAEMDMLDCAFHVRPTSRLCCQIMVQPAIDGLRLIVARR